MKITEEYIPGSIDNEDICALATPQGHGAIAIIRTSGAESISKINRIFKIISRGGDSSVLELSNPKQDSQLRSLLETNAYTMRYGAIYDGDKLLDEVLAAVFKAPHSYTGENGVEIYCHGSSYIVSEIIRILLSNGFRMAEPGEFSKRAFLNGKMDLAQTEAVADLISSETSSAHAVAMQQMKGGFSEELKEMRSHLLGLVSLMELELDFSEEEVEFADRNRLKSLLVEVKEKVDSLISSFALGNVIKNGVPVAIVGATNTGKSTLLNTLCGEERAIVSEIDGTTRDTIEDNVNIAGTMFRFIDTAGIRETKEAIEVIGIERTFAKLREASIVIMMLDCSKPDSFESNLKDLSKRINLERQKLVILLNKADYLDKKFKIRQAGTFDTLSEQIETVREISSELFASLPSILSISAKQKIGITELKDLLINLQNSQTIYTGQTIVTNLRHYQALKEAAAALDRTSEALIANTPTDLVAEEIRDAIYHIGTIVGQITTDEILGNIFGKFCIGK